MRKRMIVGLLAAGLALSLSFSQAGKAASAKGNGGTAGVNPGILAIPVPQTPPPPIFNPGVTPTVPGPSAITPSPRSSAGLATTVVPGPATGTGVPMGRAHGSRGRAGRDQSRAVNEMDKEIDRGVSICRGC